MNLIIVDNKDKINLPAVKKVEKFLPEIQKQTRAFDRSNSQTTLSMMSLTMLNGQSPMRILRQIAAESEKRVMALNEAQYSLAKQEKKVKELQEKEKRSKIEESKLRMEITKGESLLNKINGAIKDLATLAEAYDNVKEKNKIETWDEEDFEKEEKKHHIRRAFELLYRNLIEYNRPKESTMEYLQQYGVLAQVAIKLTRNFIQKIEKIIENGELPHSNILEDWLDSVSEDFKNSADITTERLFGKKDITQTDYMLNLGEKNDN